MTQTHCRTAGATEGTTAEQFCLFSQLCLSSMELLLLPHSPCNPQWCSWYRHLKGWKEMKELHPTGSHQELGIKPSSVLLEGFLQGFSAAVNNPSATYALFSPTYFTAWRQAINPGTSAEPILPDSPIFVVVLCYSISTTANFIFVFTVSIPAHRDGNGVPPYRTPASVLAELPHKPSHLHPLETGIL